MILLELYTIVFAAALAWLNKIPCQKMIDFGASIREEKEFHKVNAIVKVLFAAGLVFYHFPDVTKMILLFFLLLIISWVVFDCVLGKLLHNEWFYIGDTAKTDKLLNEVFGEQAGLMKFSLCWVIILFINFYL